MRILIFRVGSIGDTVVALPSLWFIKSSFPSARISMLINFPISHMAKEKSIASVLDGTGIVDDFIEYQSDNGLIHSIFNLRAEIRNLSPDLLIYLMPSRNRLQLVRDWLFFKLCFIPKIVGLKFALESQSTLPIPNEINRWEHESHRLARLLSDLGTVDCKSPDSWSLNLNSSERYAATLALRDLGNAPFFVLSVGTKVDVKDWGESNWLELLGQMSRIYPGHGMVFIGSADEYSNCEKLKSAWRSSCLNLCGRFEPRISAAVIEKSFLFLGHDSGPMHLAAAVGTPVVAIFSARNYPGEWYPWGNQHRVLYHKTDCFGCNLNTCVDNRKKCINSIRPVEVLEAVISSVGVR